MKTAWQSYVEQHVDQSLNELVEFLSIPSISSMYSDTKPILSAAAWVASRLEKASIESVEIMPTKGHPVVYGEWLHATGKPTVLIYGHYDTQPTGQPELWSHPPFSPVIKNGRIYARGASDDKGNMFAPILAAEALLRTEQSLPVNLKFMFEGEEEIGSPHLAEFIKTHKNLLECDIAISADGSQWSENKGALTVSIRGECGLQVDVRTAKGDLTSGLCGGTVQNSIHALVELLCSMRGPDNSIQISGFYDGIRPMTSVDKKAFAEIPFDLESYCQSLGVRGLYGEEGFSPLERVGARPTLEINGIWSGFTGEGFNPVIPSQAHAKITCRLVPSQNPENVLKAIETHINMHKPACAEVSTHRFESMSWPYRIPIDHPGMNAARDVLESIYGYSPYYVRSGIRVAVCHILLKELGVHTVTFAFGLDDEGAHAPNEFFRVSSFVLSQCAFCSLFNRLGEKGL